MPQPLARKAPGTSREADKAQVWGRWTGKPVTRFGLEGDLIDLRAGGKAPAAERDIQREAAGWDAFDVEELAVAAERHDGVAELRPLLPRGDAEPRGSRTLGVGERTVVAVGLRFGDILFRLSRFLGYFGVGLGYFFRFLGFGLGGSLGPGNQCGLGFAHFRFGRGEGLFHPSAHGRHRFAALTGCAVRCERLAEVLHCRNCPRFHAAARSLFERAHAIDPNARTLRGLGMVEFELRHYLRGDVCCIGLIAKPRHRLNANDRIGKEDLIRFEQMLFSDGYLVYTGAGCVNHACRMA